MNGYLLDFDEARSFNKESELYPDLSLNVKGSFARKLDDIDNMRDDELFEGIDKNIGDMTFDILNNNANRYKKFFTNVRFMKALSRVLYDKSISQTTRIAFNKVIYDYFCLKEKDQDIKEIMFDRLAYGINHRDIEYLKSYGFNDTNSKLMVISRYGSESEELNASRLNYQMCLMNPSVMNPESLMYIYEQLFDRVTDLFLGTMFEYHSKEEWDNLTIDFKRIHRNIGYVVLIILNNMTTPQIDTVINIYKREWENRGRKPTRFSLRSLSADYWRIANVVEYYREKNVYIP